MRQSVRRGFLFDLEKCTGCNACELACTIENDLVWGRSWRQVTTFNPDHRPGIPTFHLSLACNHCEAAPCLRQCPAQAIGRDARTGNVLIDAARCIGCKYCSWACPYGAPLFDAEAHVMTKCTGCNHRVADNLVPACVALCPTTALGYGALDQGAGVECVPGFPPTPSRPAIRFQALPDGRRAPECTWQLPVTGVAALPVTGVPAPPARAPRVPEIALAEEWPLLVFSALLPLLVGWTLGGGLRAPEDWLPQPVRNLFASDAAHAAPRAHLGLFLVGAALALGTSLLHLGHKRRAWRAVLNLRGSWLSREVAGAGGFVVVAALAGLGLGPTWVHGLASGIGIATLFVVDRVYDLVRPQERLRLHSADVLPTGLLYAAALSPWAPGVLGLVSVKLALVGVQHVQKRSGEGHEAEPWLQPGPPVPGGSGTFVLGMLRLAGLAGACAVPFVDGALRAGLFVLLVIGEIVDRVQFYAQLEMTSPQRQVFVDLSRHRRRTAEGTLRATAPGP